MLFNISKLRSVLNVMGIVLQVYIIDFGLAKKYRDLQTHKHIPYRYFYFCILAESREFDLVSCLHNVMIILLIVQET